MIRWYFDSKEQAWAYVNLIVDSRNYEVVDYGMDGGRYYIDFKEV